MRTIRLYGALAKFAGMRKIEADVSSAAEAVRCLLVNFPGVEQHMSDKYYKVKVGREDIGEEELGNPSSASKDISIIPVIVGAGGPVGRIFLGVGLIALSLISVGGAPLIGTFGAKLAFGVGASLALGGVAQLLTPVPRVNSVGQRTDNDPRESYSFSSIQNTSREGVPVPICYGERLVGSVVISAGIDTTQVKA